MSPHELATTYGVQRYIQDWLTYQDETRLAEIAVSDAQRVLDEVWKVLDSVALPLASTDQHFSAYRNKLRTISLRLSILHGILPSTLVLMGAVCIDPSKLAGVGTFADVFMGTFRGEKVALKRLRVYLMAVESQKASMKQLFYRESLLWKNLVHEHIVPFIGVAEDVFPGTICMVIQWMDNGSLRQHIDSLRTRGELRGEQYTEATEIWLFQIVDGLSYLHDEGLVHGDLHGGNILVDQAGRIGLTDFGLALVSESVSYGLGSLHGGGAMRWKAPELNDPDEFGLDNTRPTKASDVFSYACVIIEVFSGRPPMPDLSDSQVSRRYVKGARPHRPSTPDGIGMSESLWALTTSCWAQMPSDRPSAREVIAMLKIAQAPSPPPAMATPPLSVPVTKTETALKFPASDPIGAEPNAGKDGEADSAINEQELGPDQQLVDASFKEVPPSTEATSISTDSGMKTFWRSPPNEQESVESF
ncbi:hypothetical protein EIP91_001724 [Steccherinum ochraceum]|uniref:Protein kinase domain-containing protein n=1 Tax=Steccherinum ochraceum TaxID=92696 RepID=A0A4R0RDG5_9APHY|nr:hypothetical protein EIP91_001724 [Steccherinum ochraceum]